MLGWLYKAKDTVAAKIWSSKSAAPDSTISPPASSSSADSGDTGADVTVMPLTPEDLSPALHDATSPSADASAADVSATVIPPVAKSPTPDVVTVAEPVATPLPTAPTATEKKPQPSGLKRFVSTIAYPVTGPVGWGYNKLFGKSTEPSTVVSAQPMSADQITRHDQIVAAQHAKDVAIALAAEASALANVANARREEAERLRKEAEGKATRLIDADKAQRAAAEAQTLRDAAEAERQAAAAVAQLRKREAEAQLAAAEKAKLADKEAKQHLTAADAKLRAADRDASRLAKEEAIRLDAVRTGKSVPTEGVTTIVTGWVSRQIPTRESLRARAAKWIPSWFSSSTSPAQKPVAAPIASVVPVASASTQRTLALLTPKSTPLSLLKNEKILRQAVRSQGLKATLIPSETEAPSVRIDLWGSQFIGKFVKGGEFIQINEIEIPFAAIQDALVVPTPVVAEISPAVITTPSAVQHSEPAATVPVVSVSPKPQVLPIAPAVAINRPSVFTTAVVHPLQATVQPVVVTPRTDDDQAHIDLAASQAALTRAIATISDPELRTQVSAASQAAEALQQAGATPAELIPHIDATTNMLTAAPGPEREKAVAEGQKLATAAQNNSSRLWKALGIAMMVIGAAVFILGLAIIATTSGLGYLPGALAAAGGIGLFAGGFRLFDSPPTKRQEQKTEATSTSNEKIEATVSVTDKPVTVAQSPHDAENEIDDPLTMRITA